MCMGLDLEGADSRGTEYDIGKGKVCLYESILSWYRIYTLARSPGDGANTQQIYLLDSEKNVPP